METITVDSLQQKINSIADLIQLQSKQFDERLEKERAERERAYEKERAERENANKQFERQLRAIDSKHDQKYSYFIEALVEHGIIDLFATYNIHLKRVFTNLIEVDDSKQKLYEIDLWIINDKYIVVVETKTTMRTEYIKDFERKLEIIRNNPPKEFKTEGKEIIGCFAALRCNDEIAKHAMRAGFFVLYQKGNLLGIKNDKDFNFKTWKLTK